jgi:transcriptional regulator with XRE-family HTH domain
MDWRLSRVCNFCPIRKSESKRFRNSGFCVRDELLIWSMQTTDKVKFLLIEEFLAAQARNPLLSMRAFAKKVGISQAAMSQILSGKRPLSRKGALKIVERLDKNPTEYLEPLLESKSKQFQSLDMDTYHLIADWHYYAILSLAETKDFKSDVNWISARIGIAPRIVREAIARLERLELMGRDTKTNALKPTGVQLEAISPVAHAALKKACRQNIELMQKALDETEFEDRDLTAITFCFDPQKMSLAKDLIKNFRREFCRLMESGEKKEVYKMCVSLIPLTKKQFNGGEYE